MLPGREHRYVRKILELLRHRNGGLGHGEAEEGRKADQPQKGPQGRSVVAESGSIFGLNKGRWTRKDDETYFPPQGAVYGLPLEI